VSLSKEVVLSRFSAANVSFILIPRMFECVVYVSYPR
jgi:hypothetical protein